jgi:hypothetical protein
MPAGQGFPDDPKVPAFGFEHALGEIRKPKVEDRTAVRAVVSALVRLWFGFGSALIGSDSLA